MIPALCVSKNPEKTLIGIDPDYRV